MNNTNNFTTELNKNVESILNNQKLFLSTFNKAISEVMPKDLQTEMLNASEEDKRAILIHMILSLGLELTLKK
jgi:hypothetical protein